MAFRRLSVRTGPRRSASAVTAVSQPPAAKPHSLCAGSARC